MKYLEVANLDKYQHYSTRETIWIKFFIKSLNDYKFCQLRDSERWLFVGLIILGVETANNIPNNPLWIYQRLSYRSPKGSVRVAIGLKSMLKIGLIRGKNDSTERKIREDKEEKISSFKSKKPFCVSASLEARFSKGKWWALPKNGGAWLEVVGGEKDIVYK